MSHGSNASSQLLGGGGGGGCGVNNDSNTGWVWYTAPDGTAQLGICSYQVGTSLTMVTDWGLISYDGPISTVKMAVSWSDGYIDPTPEQQWPAPQTTAQDSFSHTFSQYGNKYTALTGYYLLTSGDEYGYFNEDGPSLLLSN